MGAPPQIHTEQRMGHANVCNSLPENYGSESRTRQCVRSNAQEIGFIECNIEESSELYRTPEFIAFKKRYDSATADEKRIMLAKLAEITRSSTVSLLKRKPILPKNRSKNKYP